jgi:release factor glutamine methyltransferase
MPLDLLLSEITTRLQPHSETPQLDAQVILAHILGKTRSWVIAHPEEQTNQAQVHDLSAAVRRLESGEPLPYVLGHWEFYGLDFLISPAVLIPRPETELLVEKALSFLNHPATKEQGLIQDVGTGSGCIAIAIAVNCPQRTIIASDISLAALQIAHQNIHRHVVQERVTLLQADLLSPFAAQTPCFELICANLPYIPHDQALTLPISRHEPMLALSGGADGLQPIQRLLAQSTRLLLPGGALLLEIEVSQGAAVCSLAAQFFPTAAITLHQDLAGKDRLVAVQLSPWSHHRKAVSCLSTSLR